ncbi:CpaF family protein [Clostridiales bacterium NSJ-32]|uniref:CpaF family protein n=1 Tax=Bianquea renquensis TaxID=2763661 RepID=A0A926DSF6_9FIRM|nr:CpaF family protein [Bianquea renquensis]
MESWSSSAIQNSIRGSVCWRRRLFVLAADDLGIQLYQEIKEKVRASIRLQTTYSDDEIRTIIYEVLAQESKRRYIDVKTRKSLGQKVFYALRRLDILQPLLEDESITEIMVNGPNHVFVERMGKLERSREQFESKQRLEDIIQQIVGVVNRTINEAHPIVDARLPDGSRVNAVLGPVALNGPILTIRKFREEPISQEEMIQWGTLTQESADFLSRLVRQRYNIFICGGTASGKTTLLNVLSSFIPKEERIITIEDAAELRLNTLENVVTMETRNANVEGKGAITIRDLIRTSLRMRPDRIIVGEIRGAEALDMLQALNSGHEGSLSTGHANSCRDMLSRIETMVLMGAEFPLEAIRQQIASAIDILVFISRQKGGGRHVTEIVQILDIDGGNIRTEALFQWEKGELRRTEALLARHKGSE